MMGQLHGPGVLLHKNESGWNSAWRDDLVWRSALGVTQAPCAGGEALCY